MRYTSTPKPLLIYLHGFLSSPSSVKAIETQHYITKRSMVLEYLVPAIPDTPQQAYGQLVELLEQHKDRRIGLIGSSMGGFYATVLAARYGCKAVLVNPAVAPQNLMTKYLGEQLNPYTEKPFALTSNDIEFLANLDVECPVLDNILLLAQTGDETLDYRDAVAKYSGSAQVIEDGGDHRFQDYDKHLPKIIEFLFSPSHNIT